VRALVFEFADRLAESSLKFTYLRGDELGEPQQHRRADTTPRQILDYLVQVGGARIAFRGSHNQIALRFTSK